MCVGEGGRSRALRVLATLVLVEAGMGSIEGEWRIPRIREALSDGGETGTSCEEAPDGDGARINSYSSASSVLSASSRCVSFDRRPAPWEAFFRLGTVAVLTSNSAEPDCRPRMELPPCTLALEMPAPTPYLLALWPALDVLLRPYCIPHDRDQWTWWRRPSELGLALRNYILAYQLDVTQTAPRSPIAPGPRIKATLTAR